MVTPTKDFIISEQLLEKSKNLGAEFKGLGVGLPAEILATAQTKMDGFIQVKEDIETHVAAIQVKLEYVRTIIRDNEQGGRNPHGFLTRDKDKYLRCIDLQNVELENLLRQDEEHWAENQANAKR